MKDISEHSYIATSTDVAHRIYSTRSKISRDTSGTLSTDELNKALHQSKSNVGDQSLDELAFNTSDSVRHVDSTLSAALNLNSSLELSLKEQIDVSALDPSDNFDCPQAGMWLVMKWDAGNMRPTPTRSIRVKGLDGLKCNLQRFVEPLRSLRHKILQTQTSLSLFRRRRQSLKPFCLDQWFVAFFILLRRLLARVECENKYEHKLYEAVLGKYLLGYLREDFHLSFRLWDFACMGQNIYSGWYKFFVGEYSIFVLAVDLSRSTHTYEQMKMIWWLRSIQNHSGLKTRVLLVGCKSDLCNNVEKRCELLLRVIRANNKPTCT